MQNTSAKAACEQLPKQKTCAPQKNSNPLFFKKVKAKMMITKWTLVGVGIIVLLMGIWGLVAGTAGWEGVVDPWWHAVMKIIVGIVAVAIGFMYKSSCSQKNN